MSANRGGVAAGLVTTSTTHTAKGLLSKAIELLPKEVRLKKMKQSVLTAARLHSEQAQRQGFRFRAAMITLTYAPGQHWDKCHVRDFLTIVRNHMARRGQKLRYVWVAELQQRGMMHYHVLLWLPRRFRLPKPDSAGWWNYGSSRIEWARKAAGYLSKYASKADSKHEYPRGARISGLGGLDPESRREYRWWRAPKTCREFLGQTADIKRITGGRVDALTGAFWESPWRFVLINGRPHLIPKGAFSC